MGSCTSKEKTMEEGAQIYFGAKPITIETETWKRDSHGLFDYETNDVVRRTLRVVGTTQLYRDNDYIEQTAFKYKSSRRADVLLNYSFESRNNTITDREDLEENKDDPFSSNIDEHVFDEHQPSLQKDQPLLNTPVAHIVYKNGKYWIYSKPFYNKSDDFITKPEELIWYTIRDYKDSASSFGYKLVEGDICKFGRARLKVVKIRFDEENGEATPEVKFDSGSPILHLDISTGSLLQIPKVQNDDEVKTCRVCFVEGDPQNPLISACK